MIFSCTAQVWPFWALASGVGAGSVAAPGVPPAQPGGGGLPGRSLGCCGRSCVHAASTTHRGAMTGSWPRWVTLLTPAPCQVTTSESAISAEAWPAPGAVSFLVPGPARCGRARVLAAAWQPRVAAGARSPRAGLAAARWQGPPRTCARVSSEPVEGGEDAGRLGAGGVVRVHVDPADVPVGAGDRYGSESAPRSCRRCSAWAGRCRSTAISLRGN